LGGLGFNGDTGSEGDGDGPGGGEGSSNGGQGAGYGGEGGDGNGNPNTLGSSYGSITKPLDLGSGGGTGLGRAGGNGGGAIFLNVTDTLNVTGNIIANGSAGVTSQAAGGGGSGGSIYIITNKFVGNGTISADGGDGGDDINAGNDDGGSGAGGRIAIYYKTKTFDGTIQTPGGTSSFAGTGEDGTNFTASNITILLTINQTTNVVAGQNLTIYGNLSVSAYNLTNFTFNVYIDDVRYYINSTENALKNVNTGIEPQTNFTAVGGDNAGEFRYNITVPDSFANDGSTHTITVNATLVIISGNASSDFQMFNAPDTTFPIVNTTFNFTTPYVYDVINFTGNVTDETGLLSANITINFSAGTEFFNYTLSGTTAQVSNATDLTGKVVVGDVLNFTMYVTDTSNNVKQNSTLLTVALRCRDLDHPNFNYNLTQDVESAATCFYVKANDITLDCKGFEINYSQVDIGYGVNVTSDSTTVKSCIVAQGSTSGSSGDGSYGIYATNIINSIFKNNTVVTLGTSGYAIYLSNSGSNNVTNNSIDTSGSTGYGIYIFDESDDNVVEDNEINTSNSNGYGIYLRGSVGDIPNFNKISNNVIRTETAIGIFSDAAKKNNISSNTITVSGNEEGISLVNDVAGNVVNGNTINVSGNADGINAFNGNMEISGNTIIVSGSGGISGIKVNSGSKFNITNNKIISTDRGIYVSSNINRLINNTINTSGSNGYGIYIDGNSDRAVVDSNTINTSGSGAYGIYLVDSGSSDPDFNNLTNNVIRTIGTDAYGVFLSTDVEHTLVSNNNITTTNNGGRGISLAASINNNIVNNTINTSGTAAYGVYLTLNAYNNSIYSNTITTKNAGSSYGIYLLDNVNNNTFYRNSISSLAIGILINGSGQSTGESTRFNTFTNDTIITCTIGCASDYQDIVLTANVTDITFTNVSFNKSRVAFVERDPTTPVEKNNLTVRWYLKVNVSNSSNNKAIDGALVTINDSFDTTIFDGDTDATGGIPVQIVTEYTQNGSVPFDVNGDTCAGLNNPNITCFTPHNITVNITGYTDAFVSKSINRSRLLNISMDETAVVDTTFPIVNTTLNKSLTNIVFGDVINITANITDETGLSFCQIIINQSGPDNIEIINISLGGATTAQCSNSSPVILSAGGVINYTIRVNDTSNNFRTNDTIITVIDPDCDEGTRDTLCIINTIRDVDNNTVKYYHDLTIQNGGALRNQTSTVVFNISANNIIIEDGGYIAGNVNINASNLTIFTGGFINLSGVGFPSLTSGSGKNGTGPGRGQGHESEGGQGAGYGGEGGDGDANPNTFGSSYGSITQPLDLGSGS